MTPLEKWMKNQKAKTCKKSGFLNVGGSEVIRVMTGWSS